MNDEFDEHVMNDEFDEHESFGVVAWLFVVFFIFVIYSVGKSFL